MLKQLHFPFAGQSKSKSEGQEKFTFLYGALSAVAVALAIIYSVFAGFSWQHCLLLSIGAAVVGYSIAFTFAELYKSDKTKKVSAAEAAKEEEVYAPRPVSVSPPTGDPYPHHEDYTESQGLDQGQLTARIPGTTPFVGELESRHGKQEEKAAKP